MYIRKGKCSDSGGEYQATPSAVPQALSSSTTSRMANTTAIVQPEVVDMSFGAENFIHQQVRSPPIWWMGAQTDNCLWAKALLRPRPQKTRFAFEHQPHTIGGGELVTRNGSKAMILARVSKMPLAPEIGGGAPSVNFCAIPSPLGGGGWRRKTSQSPWRAAQDTAGQMVRMGTQKRLRPVTLRSSPAQTQA